MQNFSNNWIAKVVRMKNVYDNAFITITIINFRNINNDIFKFRKISQIFCNLIWHIFILFKCYYIHFRFNSNFWNIILKYEFLNTRDWTLQKSFFAQKIFSYDTQQMIWKCQYFKINKNEKLMLLIERHRNKTFVQFIVSNDFNTWTKTKLIFARLFLNYMFLNLTIVFENWKKKKKSCTMIDTL